MNEVYKWPFKKYNIYKTIIKPRISCWANKKDNFYTQKTSSKSQIQVFFKNILDNIELIF